MVFSEFCILKYSSFIDCYSLIHNIFFMIMSFKQFLKFFIKVVLILLSPIAFFQYYQSPIEFCNCI